MDRRRHDDVDGAAGSQVDAFAELALETGDGRGEPLVPAPVAGLHDPRFRRAAVLVDQLLELDVAAALHIDVDHDHPTASAHYGELPLHATIRRF